MSFDPPLNTVYLCPRCSAQAEVVEQSEGVYEVRCPRCQQTLGMAFDHTVKLAPSETGEE